MPRDFPDLASHLPDLESPDFDFGSWAGADELPDGTISMPYFSYSAKAEEIIRAMPVEVFDWSAWMATDEARDFRSTGG